MLTVVNIMLLTVISSTLSLYVHSRIYFISDLQSKKDAVHYIQKDAKKEFYNVYPFCHTLVCYEYTYLFKWIINKDIPYDLSKNRKANLHHIIVPNIDKKYYKDIFEKSAPDSEYSIVSHKNLGMITEYKYRRTVLK